MSGATLDDAVALTVHGPAGAVDLLVPSGASGADVLREYAAQSGSRLRLQVFTATGTHLPPDVPLSSSGVRSGALLVATPPMSDVLRPGRPDDPTAGRPAGRPDDVRRPGRPDDPTAGRPDRLRVVPAVVAAVAATVTAAAAAALVVHTPGTVSRDSVLVLLAVTAAVGVLPIGRGVALRGTVAPAFGAAVAYAIAWQPGAASQPLTIGAAGLGAAVVAAMARASGAGRPEVHAVWMLTGVGVFLVTGLTVLAGAPPQVAWAVLLLVAVLSARWTTALAVDVPDPMLIDLDRLSVTAWTARDRPGRSGQSAPGPVPAAGVADVLARGSRVVDAAALAILLVTVLATPLLLATATYDVDRTGASSLVLLAGAGLLLTARSFRHPRARGLLRLAGLLGWAFLVGHHAADLSAPQSFWVTGVCVVLAGAVLVAAVATGRGWRSAVWAARGDLVETAVGSAAIAAAVVATGLVRLVWEIPFAG